MSYDIELTDPKTGEICMLDERHQLRGGTYCIGGTDLAELNVTYNYSEHFYRVMGEKGIRSIYGLTGEQSVSVLKSAIEQLGDDVSRNYWDATEGNAKAALRNLLTLAEMAPHGVWKGD